MSDGAGVTHVVELAMTVDNGLLNFLHLTDDLVKLDQLSWQLIDLRRTDTHTRTRTRTHARTHACTHTHTHTHRYTTATCKSRRWHSGAQLQMSSALKFNTQVCCETRQQQARYNKSTRWTRQQTSIYVVTKRTKVLSCRSLIVSWPDG